MGPYTGPEIYLENLVIHQEHSIVSQSIAATKSTCCSAKTLHEIATIMDKHKSDEPMRISCALTDGKQIWAFRYSSDDQSPSMYYGAPHTRASTTSSNPITTIASEPSDSDSAHWFKVEERTGIS